jgi:tyrosine-protein kinase Etk/Wzc
LSAERSVGQWPGRDVFPLRDGYLDDAAAGAPGPSAPGDDGRQPDVWGTVRRNWILIVACVVLATGAAAAAIHFVVPIYEASTTVQIDEKQSGLPVLEVLQSLSAGSGINTEKEILASRTVAEDAVASLGLQIRVTGAVNRSRDELITAISVARDVRPSRYELVRQPDHRFSMRDTAGATLATVRVGEPVSLSGIRFRLTPMAAEEQRIELSVVSFDDALDALRSAISIKRLNRDVSIVEVRYRDADRVLARAVPNAIASRFIRRRQESKQDATRATVAFLREQSTKRSAELRRAENELRAFRDREHVVNLAEQARTQIARLAELQAQRGGLETERSALARLVAATRREAAGQGSGEATAYRRMIAFPTLLRSPAAAQLLAAVIDAESRRTELLSRRSPDDADVKLLTGRVADLEDQLRQTVDTYLEGLTDQVSAIDATLAQSRGPLASIPYQEIRLAQLERDVKTLADIYALVQSRLKEAEIAAAIQDGTVQVIDSAATPRHPVEPRPTKTLALALVAGLVLGVSASFAREIGDKSIHSRRDIQNLTGAPVLGLLPEMEAAESARSRVRHRMRRLLPDPARRALSGGLTAQAKAVATRPGPTWTAAREALNGLHANVAAVTTPSPGRRIIITSPAPGDGKTTVAVNFAVTLARQGQKVVLVDGDLRRGIVHAALRLPRTPGFSDVLSGVSDLGGALRTMSTGGGPTGGGPTGSGRMLHVLTSGTRISDPTQVLGPGRLGAVLERLASEFDWVIIDSPPLNVVADASLLSTTGAAVVLVARAGVTPATGLRYAVEQLRGVRAYLAGTVLNGIDRREASYDNVYSFYEYAAIYEEMAPRRRRALAFATELGP